MSGTAIIRYLLANDAGLIAVVPAARIMSGVLPLLTTLPAIGVMQISGVPRLNIAMGTAAKLVTDRIQVTVEATTYVQAKSILALVRAACPVSRGTVNGVYCDSVLPDMEGPDFFDYETSIYSQSQDFIVKFSR